MLSKPSAPSPDSATRARRLACALLLGATVPAGLVWRLAPLHFPPFAFKYGGSALWAMAVYWVVASLLPRRSSACLGLLAGTIALAVELFKRVHLPLLDRFRDTLGGKLLLGRYFTLGAIAAYWIAIAVVALLDARLRPARR